MQNEYFSAPNLSEFDDLQTFLKKSQEKKRLEKERKRQPLISTFFKRIKKEDNGYEADDENIIRPNMLTPTPLRSLEASNLESNTLCEPHRNLTSASDKVFGSGVTLSAFTQVSSVSKCETTSLDRDVHSPTYAVHHETTMSNTAMKSTIVDNVKRESHLADGNGCSLTIQPSSITASENDTVKEICRPRQCTDQKCQTDVVPTVAQKVQTDNIALSVEEIQTDSIELATSGAQTEIQTSTDHEV